MTSEFLDKVRDDVLKTGYVTEMVVTSILGRLQWIALDHTYYLDKDENRGREIDAVAVKSAEAGSNRKRVNVVLALAIEIKKAENKPWVIFTSPKQKDFEISGLFETVLARMNNQEIWFKELYRQHPVMLSDRLGRVSYQAFSKGRENSDDTKVVPTFGAFVSCFKASNELVGFLRQADNAQLRDEKQTKTYQVGITHGLLVVDGKLIEAIAQEDGQVEVRESERIPYVFSYASKEYGNKNLLIDVVTLAALDDYLKQYSAWLQSAATFCLGELS